MSNPNVTVVVCSYNRADSLAQALKSLTCLETDGFSYEILVVDNASTDHTPQVVAAAASSDQCLVRYVKESQPGVSFARNCGVQNAAGEWLVFFDDDELAEPDWLIQLLRAAHEQNVKSVSGAIKIHLIEAEEREPKLKPWVRVMFNCTRDMKHGRFHNKKNTPGTGNMLVHKEVFERVGLFRTDLVEGGEDTDLFHRMREKGYEVYYTPTALVHHQVPGFRLEPKYLKPASMRMGSHVARREFNQYSRLLFPFVVAARGLQGVFLHGGRLALARLGGDPEMILEKQCKWWLGIGYVQAAWRFIRFKENAVSGLEFRSERKPASD